MDLFEYMRQQNMKDESPLASRLRPTTLDEVVGQQHIVGKDKLLYRAIKADKLSSIIFYGPPGTGKTTLAKVIAKEGTTLAQLVVDEKVENPEYVTVTVNDDFVENHDLANVTLKENDVVEFLYFMGGGSF